MALLYPASTGHNTDSKYSALVEPNLFAGNVFQPGISFTDKYQLGPGGTILVHMPSIDVISATAPGADFSDVINQDTLITIQLNKQYNRSRKIYGATAASVTYPIAAAELELASREIKEAWNLTAATELIGTASILVADNLLTVLAADTVYDSIVTSRQELVEAKANPDTLIVTPQTYSLLLQATEFQRTGVIGDSAVANGVVGRVAGMNVFEYASLDTAAADGATIAGITWASGDLMEYVMYDHDAFSIITSVNLVRVIDSHTFNGTNAQVEVVSGFKLTNPSRALVKIHDTSAS
jgi:hypothetical protein